ncbi:ABC transporter substrate-binding protein [Actinophytocola algeriensis]|uniref:Peptide/nickel transport system substrate-binding protein n=1 Tax=Actinophytocola algeriensis TaxID=1768010 RepID=A0A7W7Q7Q4_9PSEU|nr:ABC transporter substrate-binding protein [Actinophytocola algeriensis]MBB4908631.1 peptide/nickel transport system substrate-binding protein [Actinophytocola algeriensis]MBE1474982.1 peptide/nickel transport system substrate-binding protein [Actinophytocola algeriensis]
MTSRLGRTTGAPRRAVRGTRLAAVTFAVALGVTACGGGSGGDGAAGGSATFTYALTGLPTSLDPADYQGDPSRNIGFELASSLFRWDTEGLPNQGCDTLANVDQLTGQLAESHETSEDGKVITVKLRDATSAAGNTLTSNDVKWTFDRLIALEVGTPNTLMQDVADYTADPIKVVDDKTFEIHLDNPGAMSLAILTWAQFRILDSTDVKKHVTDADPWGKEYLLNHSATFGPWTQEPGDFVAGDRLTLKANPNYKGERGDVTKLVFLSVPDASSRAQLVSTGNASYGTGLQYEQYAQLKDTPGVDVQTCASADRIPLVLNATDPNLGKPEVRRAISLAVDRQSIVDAVYRGFNKPSTGGLSQAYGIENTENGTYKHDVAQAKQLMAQAGVGNFPITLHISPSRPGPEAEQIAILLQSQLKEIGIDVKIQTVASATEINTIFHDGTFQALLYLEPPAVADPYYSIFLYNSSFSKLNTYGYRNPELDDLARQVGSMSPGEDRDRLVTEASEQMVENPPFIYLVDRDFVHAVREGFTNYQHAPNGEMFVYTLEQG